MVSGASVATVDVDSMQERMRLNVRRRLAALEELGARFRVRRDVRLVLTRDGPLDVLGTVGNGRDFPALARADSCGPFASAATCSTCSATSIATTPERAPRA